MTDNFFTRNQIADSSLLQLKGRVLNARIHGTTPCLNPSDDDMDELDNYLDNPKITLKIDYSHGAKEILDGVSGRSESTAVQTRNIRIRIEGGKTPRPDPR